MPNQTTAVVLVSRRRGTDTWRVRNDRFFHSSSTETRIGHLEQQRKDAQQQLNAWCAAEPQYEFNVIEVEYHKLGPAQSYLNA